MDNRKDTVQMTLDGKKRDTYGFLKNPTLEGVRTGAIKQKRYIKFRRNNVGKHKGLYWEKLVRYEEVDEIDTVGEGIPEGKRKPIWTRNMKKPAYLVKVVPMWASDLTIRQIRKDTFDDWTRADFKKWLKMNYGRDNIFGLLLYFKHVDGRFTTFRPYTVRTHNYWESMIDREVYIHAR